MNVTNSHSTLLLEPARQELAEVGSPSEPSPAGHPEAQAGPPRTSRKQRKQAPAIDNAEVAQRLEETAALLEQQGANRFRVEAYRRGARAVRELRGPLEGILAAEGIAGLTRLPGIGRSLAHAIEQLVRSGRFALLERLRGEDQPERTLATVPGIGPVLASQIHQELGIETLLELEAAAQDGRLAQLPGMGRKRIQSVRESLAGRFARRRAAAVAYSSPEPAVDVSVEILLAVDRQYRRSAQQGKLPRIAPRRFNPTGEAWLPVLHTEHQQQHFTALFSNTARAHELGATHDWVVIYQDDNGAHGRWTVITSQFGKLKGLRIVRGREAECARYYQQEAARDS